MLHKKNWAKNRTNWGKWNKWETRKEQRVRKKADAEREKEPIYLMQSACKSGVYMKLKWWFVTMAILGNKSGWRVA